MRVLALLILAAIPMTARADGDTKSEVTAACEKLGGAIVAAFGADFAGEQAKYTRGTAEQLGKLLCEVGGWPREARACFEHATTTAASLACVERLPVTARLELEAGMAGVNPNGCEVGKTQIKLKGPILFDDSDRIHPASDAMMHGLARMLVANPAIRIEIQAYVDDAEKGDRAQKRSQRRADAVRAFLVKRQVTEERMVARGLGAATPVADNATELGRARNRRIELMILPPRP
jgi:outer membrane protein OmpA-like peptidoglycan-associated protein